MIIKCYNCKKDFEKSIHEIKRTKTGKHFCSRKCNFLYKKAKNITVICIQCNNKFEILERENKQKQRKFCNHSCAATYNNLGITRHKKEKKRCICGKILHNKNKSGCCRLCLKKPIERLSKNSKTILRNRIFKERGRKCEKCGWDKINIFTNIIPVQLHHKDGDNSNNKLENLEILCPSCHSLTEHFMFYGKTHNRK